MEWIVYDEDHLAQMFSNKKIMFDSPTIFRYFLFLVGNMPLIDLKKKWATDLQHT